MSGYDAGAGARAAVFFDLQGTLGGDGFGDIRDFEFYPCASEAIRLVNEAGLLAVVVTNQTRISQGEFTIEYFSERVGGLRRQLSEAGARLDGVYCCPHRREDRCECHKPRTGMIDKAVGDLGIDLPRSWVVGDGGAWDMVLARTAGCGAVLVRTGLGEGSLSEFRHTWAKIEPDHVAEDALDAARWIVRERQRPGMGGADGGAA